MQKDVLKYFAKFTRKHLYQSLFFNKVASLDLQLGLKKRLWHMCFPVNFLRTFFYLEYLRWLILYLIKLIYPVIYPLFSMF